MAEEKGETLIITDMAELDDIIQSTIEAGQSFGDESNHLLPFYRAAKIGALALVFIRRDVSEGLDMPLIEKISNRKPTVIMVGDDDYRSTGPSGWPSILPQMETWRPAKIVVHAAAGDPAVSLALVSLTMERRRVLVIETDSEHEAAWEEWALRLDPAFGTVTITPPDGGHPVTEHPPVH